MYDEIVYIKYSKKKLISLVYKYIIYKNIKNFENNNYIIIKFKLIKSNRKLSDFNMIIFKCAISFFHSFFCFKIL